jgi:hypothetical protein
MVPLHHPFRSGYHLHLVVVVVCLSFDMLALWILVSLNCASISQDGALVVGGFSDSSLKVSVSQMSFFIFLFEQQVIFIQL